MEDFLKPFNSIVSPRTAVSSFRYSLPGFLPETPNAQVTSFSPFYFNFKLTVKVSPKATKIGDVCI